MATGLERQHCANHPERYGHALCMACRKTVCQECATSWDGINYCVACLADRSRGSTERGSALRWIAVLAAVIALFYAGHKMMVWGTALMTRSWSLDS